MSVCDRGDLGTRAARNQFVQHRLHAAICDDGIVMMRCAKAIARAELSRPTLRSPRSYTRLAGPWATWRRVDRKLTTTTTGTPNTSCLNLAPVILRIMRRSALVPLPPLLLVSVFSEPAAARGSAPAALGLRRIGGGRSAPARASTSTTKPELRKVQTKFEFSKVTHLMRSNKWVEKQRADLLCIPHDGSSSARGMRAVCAHQRRERHRQRAWTVCVRTPKGQINASHIPSDVS
jgi:hypothetical protein